MQRETYTNTLGQVIFAISMASSSAASAHNKSKDETKQQTIYPGGSVMDGKQGKACHQVFSYMNL